MFKKGWFFSGQFLSSTGDWLTNVAQVVVVYQITNSALSIAIVLLIKFLPKIASPFLSVRINQVFDAKLSMVLLDFMRAIIVAACWIGAIIQQISIIYLCVFLQHFLSGIYFPTRICFLSEIYKNRQDYTRAIALIGTLTSVGMVLGNLLGAVIISTMKVELMFLIDSGTYLASAFLTILSTSAKSDSKTEVKKNLGNSFHALHTGLKEILASRSIFKNINNISLRLVSESAIQYLVVVYVIDIFNRSKANLSMTYLSMGIGTIIALVLTKFLPILFWIRLRFIRPAFIFIQIILWAVAFFSNSYISFTIAIGISGIFMLILSSDYEASIFSDISEEKRQLIASVYTLFRVVSLILGIVIASIFSAKLLLLSWITIIILLINFLNELYSNGFSKVHTAK